MCVNLDFVVDPTQLCCLLCKAVGNKPLCVLLLSLAFITLHFLCAWTHFPPHIQGLASTVQPIFVPTGNESSWLGKETQIYFTWRSRGRSHVSQQFEKRLSLFDFPAGVPPPGQLK